MRRTAAKCVLAGWMIMAVCTVSACSQAGSVKSAVSSLASSVAASVTRSPASLPAAPSREGASTAAEAATTDSAPTTDSAATPTPTAGGGGATTTAPTTAPAQPTTPAATTPAATTPAATTPAATTAPASPSPTPTTGTSSSVPTWLWVLIGAVAVIALIAGIIAWTTSASRRRTAASTAWRNQMVDAYAKGAALYDAMSAAEVPGALAAPDAPARWYDIQRRADDYGQLLYTLRERATDEEDRMRISNVLASLQAARSAMEAERGAGGASSSMAATVRDRLAFFGGSLSGLRQQDNRPS